MNFLYSHSQPQEISSRVGLDLRSIKMTERLLGKLRSHSEFNCFPQNSTNLLVQLGLMSLVIKQGTVKDYRGSLNVLLSKTLSARDQLNSIGVYVSFADTLPESFDGYPWFYSLDWKDVEKLYESIVAHTYPKLATLGNLWRPLIIQLSLQHHPNFSDDEIMFAATAISPMALTRNRLRSPKNNWVDIDWNTLQSLLATFSLGTPAEGFVSMSTHKKNLPGIARLITQAIWLTGMRPIETINCTVIDRRNNKAFIESYGILDQSFKLTNRSGDGGKLIDNGLHNFIKKGATFDYTLDERKYLTLKIYSAKTTNSSSKINKHRLMRLDRINHNHLQILLLTSCLRWLLLSQSEYRHLTKICNQLLGKASLEIIPNLKYPITLYYLRHAFINDARRSLPVTEVGVLAGHTSKRTLYHYGGKYIRYSKKAKIRPWFPTPDAHAVKQLKQHWNRPLVDKQSNGVASDYTLEWN